jgi:hypothetical protein
MATIAKKIATLQAKPMIIREATTSTTQIEEIRALLVASSSNSTK